MTFYADMVVIVRREDRLLADGDINIVLEVLILVPVLNYMDLHVYVKGQTISRFNGRNIHYGS